MMSGISEMEIVRGLQLYLLLSQVKRIPKHVHVAISDVSLSFPDKIAVQHGQEVLTYKELEEKSNIVANYLIKSGVLPETCIGVYFKESVLIPVAVLGILKAGATYVPLSYEHPRERLEKIIDDAGISIVLTNLGAQIPFQTNGRSILHLDAHLSAIPEKSTQFPTQTVKNTDAAYIIYTSGSTGDPKGVVVEHESLSNYLDWYLADLQPQSGANLPLSASITFAAGVTQLFSSLLMGQTLHIIDRAVVRQPPLLLEWFSQHPGFGLYCVPTLWEEIMDFVEQHPEQKISPPACLFLSGEALPKSLCERSFAQWPDINIWNLYGPTEATANVSFYKVESGKEIFLGKPIRGARVFLLDDDMNPVPQGEEGYIYIASEALARDYRNKPELSRKAFLTEHSLKEYEGYTIYNTGDIGRFNEENELVFLGRKDQQVKLRGHRIELSEVEKHLNSVPGIRQAVCKITSDRHGVNQLTAFVVCKADPVPIDQIRAELAKQLPPYMIPDHFRFLEALPKLANFKINRNSLPLTNGFQPRPTLSYPKIAPATAQEQELVQLIEGVLEIEGIGMQDDFFDLGCNSLKLTRLAFDIHAKLGKSIGHAEIWGNPSPAKLLKILAGKPATQIQTPKHDREVQAADKGFSPLSFAQTGIWFIMQSRPEQTAYNLLYSLKMSGQVSPETLRAALKAVLGKHETLRSNFKIANKIPVRAIREDAEPVLDFVEQPLPGDALEQSILQHRFDLSEDSLIRFTLVREGEDAYRLLVLVHHILFDGLSIDIFTADFCEAYSAAVQAETSDPSLSTLEYTYADYEQSLKKNYFDGKLSDAYDFWKRQLESSSFFLNLPTDFPRPKIQNFTGKIQTLSIAGNRFAALKTFNVQTKTTPFAALLSVFKLLLHRYTRESEIIVGVPFANRPHDELLQVIGLFVNTVVFKTRFEAGGTFSQLLQGIKGFTAQALQHQSYPFEKLVEKLNPERSVSYHPLFQVLFAYHGKLEARQTADGIYVATEEILNPACKFDLDVEAQEVENGIEIHFNYNSELFEDVTIGAMLEQFAYLLDQGMAQPDLPMADFQLQEPALLAQKLASWNDTACDVDETFIQERLERQALKTPDALAVKSPQGALSYQQLNQKANQIAWFLRAKGVQAESVVGIKAERSLEMIAGIFGILKAGAAYLPIDPAVPPERLRYMAANSGLTWLLSMAKPDADPSLPFGQTWLGDTELFAAYPVENPPALGTPSSLAYVLYTSGSTGEPKGVMVEHRSVVNRIDWMQKAYPLGSEDVILQKTPFTFDVSVWELFWWSFQGSSVYLLEPEGEKNPQSIIRALREERVSTLHFVPSMLNTFLEYLKDQRVDALSFQSLKQVFASGEALEKYHVEKFDEQISAKLPARLVNLYGPTEATVDVSCFDCKDFDGRKKVPIGKPIDNISLFVLDQNDRPLPEKIPGELCIGGIGLARGYINNPELSGQKFFFHQTLGTRLYRTGDLARWLPDGNIEFIGRLDHQVKIRGFRIELGEIENVLNKHPQVEASVVAVRKIDLEDTRIVAWYKPKNGEAPLDLKKFLRATLPEFMIPAAFVAVADIPLLSNGKTDLKSLPEPFSREDRVIGERQYNNDYEKVLANIWQQVLKHDAFELDDNFYDVGGYSLLLIKMKHFVDEAFGIDVPVVDLFRLPTVRLMAAEIADKSKSKIKQKIADRASRQRMAMQKINLSRHENN